MYQAAHRSAAPISGPVWALYWRTSEGWAVRCGIDMYIHNHIYIYMYVLYYINITFEYIMYMYDYIYYIYTYSIWIILIIIICGENGQVSGFTSSWLHEMGNPPVADETTDQSKQSHFFLGKISANWLSMISLIFRNMIGWRLRVGKFLCTCTFVLTDGSSYRVPIQGGIRMIHLASRWCPQL